MATRSIWKGAVSFGLVHVPVALIPASTSGGIDFDWLDRRSLDPVGYKRVNKRTGREVDKQHIARGVKVGDGRYVIVGDDEIRAAYPRTTQTIEIEAFVKAPEVPFTYLDAPYFLEPLARGEKVYALLREAMLGAGVVGIARVVLHSKQHLAALVPAGPALMLNTLRWASDMRPLSAVKLPPAGRKAAALKDAELKMAQKLIADMTTRFEPERYSDAFADAVNKLVRRRLAAGKTAEVEQPLEDPGPARDNVVDLSELLAQSLRKGRPAAAGKSAGASAARKAATTRKRA